VSLPPRMNIPHKEIELGFLTRGRWHTDEKKRNLD
jgi:hypothetical protein